MRTGVVIARKILFSLLIFVIGFLTAFGAIAGGTYLIYKKVSIDEINESGIINIDTSKFCDEDAEVPVNSLTLSGIVSEYLTFKSLGDEGTVDLLITKYGFIVPSGLDFLLNEKVRNIPVTKLLSDEGKAAILKAYYIGMIFDYERVENPDYTPTNGQKEYVWMDEGVLVTGINSVIADYTLYRLLTEGINSSDLSNQLSVAEFLNYSSKDYSEIYINDNGTETKIDDMDSFVVWYDKGGNLADKTISAVAGTPLANVGSAFETLKIADIVGLVEYKGDYYNWTVKNDEYILLTREDGMLSDFADIGVKLNSDELDSAVSDIELYKVLNYTLGADGKYYDNNGNAVTGIIASLAGDKVKDIDTSVHNIKIGEVSDFTYHEGKWYSTFNAEDPSMNVEATGILASLADLTVDDMSDESKLSEKVQTIEVADVLGYKLKDDGKYYQVEGGEEKAVTGVMSVIAGTPVNEIQTKLDESSMGEILGFTNKEGKWFDENDQEVHVLMQKVSDTKFDELSTLTDTLTLSDLVSEEDRQEGFISLVPADTKIDDISETVGNIFNETKLSKFINSKSIVFENPADGEKLLASPFADKTIPQILSYLVNLP